MREEDNVMPASIAGKKFVTRTKSRQCVRWWSPIAAIAPRVEVVREEAAA